MVALVQSVEERSERLDDRFTGHGRDLEKDTLVLERRIFGRRRVNVEADARRLDHTIAARRDPRVKLMVKDLSLGGLSAVSTTRIECGEYVGVTFPPELGQRGWNAFGRVIRCEEEGAGYKVAVAFEALPAA